MSRAARIVALALVACGFAGGALACTSDPVLGSGETDSGSPVADAATDAWSDGAATTSSTTDGGTPVTPGEAGISTDGGDPVDANDPCSPVIERILSGALAPPNVYAGFWLARGANPKGLTVDEANVDHCGVPGPSMANGYRTLVLGGDDGVSLSYNMESRIIYQIVLGHDYQGTARFHSHVGGHFGVHSYEIGIPFVRRDGIDMALDWNDPEVTWADELFDALSDTYSPGTIPSNNCHDDSTCVVTYNDYTNEAFFGASDISFYVVFAGQTNRVETMYGFWRPGQVDCSTPLAAHEAMDLAPITAGDSVSAPSIGGLSLSQPSPDGLTRQLADAEKCNGVQVPSKDPGYVSMQWGERGELELEYNPDTQIAYKLIAKDGYRGTLDGQDGFGNTFSIGVGAITENGRPFVIDWSAPLPQITILSNAFNGAIDTDCVAAGRCKVVNDGIGHIDLELVTVQIHVVFSAKGTGPDAIYAIWPKGKIVPTTP